MLQTLDKSVTGTYLYSRDFPHGSDVYLGEPTKQRNCEIVVPIAEEAKLA
jgi:hypothetical protein